MKILKLLEKNRYEIKLNKTGLYRFVEEGSKELVEYGFSYKVKYPQDLFAYEVILNGIRNKQVIDECYNQFVAVNYDIFEYVTYKERQRMINQDEEKVIAIGEIGLDYYWNKENKKEQKEVFIKQIEIANKKNLPIVIHCRDAHTDLIEILKEKMDCNKKGVFHCVALNLELIKNALNLGYYISFAGPITYKNSKNADEAIKLVPLDKILIETDSPYLAPEPKRGTRNDSTNLVYIAEKISQVKQIKIEEFVKITYENTKKIFNIK